MTRAWLVILLVSVLACEAAAQNKQVSPGPPPVKVDAAAIDIPKPASDLQAGSFKYRATILQGPQKFDLITSITIKEENGAWAVAEVNETPAGPATDMSILEKGTLALRKRTVQQDPVTINIDVNGTKATGMMNFDKQIPISVELGGPVFADGPAAGPSIAVLPLAEGYKASFRNLDLGRQKAIVMQLSVVATEPITVPAGTFNALRVEVSSEDTPLKRTFWIEKDSRKVVKISASAADAAATSELMP